MAHLSLTHGGSTMGTVGREAAGPQVDEIIDLLNQGIAAEINDAYRYLMLSTIAAGVHAPAVVKMFARLGQNGRRRARRPADPAALHSSTPHARPDHARAGRSTEARTAPQEHA